jgi:hypothetical protein
MIYLLTAVGLPPGGSSTVHIHTQTIHRMTQNKQYIEQHKNFGRVLAVPQLGELYPGICLTTEEKAQKNLSQISPPKPCMHLSCSPHVPCDPPISFFAHISVLVQWRGDCSRWLNTQRSTYEYTLETAWQQYPHC